VNRAELNTIATYNKLTLNWELILGDLLLLLRDPSGTLYPITPADNDCIVFNCSHNTKHQLCVQHLLPFKFSLLVNTVHIGILFNVHKYCFKTVRNSTSWNAKIFWQKVQSAYSSSSQSWSINFTWPKKNNATTTCMHAHLQCHNMSLTLHWKPLTGQLITQNIFVSCMVLKA